MWLEYAFAYPDDGAYLWKTGIKELSVLEYAMLSDGMPAAHSPFTEMSAHPVSSSKLQTKKLSRLKPIEKRRCVQRTMSPVSWGMCATGHKQTLAGACAMSAKGGH